MKKLVSIFIYLTLCSFSQENPITKAQNYALALNKRAIRVLTFADAKNLNQEQRSILALKLLDSATKINKNYNPAYINKLSSLIILKNYADAISIIDKIIKKDPNSFNTLIKGGIIYNDYLNKQQIAKLYFRKAYKAANQSVQKQKNYENHYKVAVSLLYLSGKKVALNYVNNLYIKYKNNQMTLMRLNQLRTLITTNKLDKESNFQWFCIYDTNKY